MPNFSLKSLIWSFNRRIGIETDEAPESANSPNPVRMHQEKSVFDTESIETFFQDDSKLPSKKRNKVLLFSFFFLVTLIYLSVHNAFFSEEGDVSILEIAEKLLPYGIAIVISFISSLLAVEYINSNNFKKNFSIRRLAHDGLLGFRPIK